MTVSNLLYFENKSKGRLGYWDKIRMKKIKVLKHLQTYKNSMHFALAMTQNTLKLSST